MKKMRMKKGFAIILSLALVLQCIPAMAFATEDAHGVDTQRANTFGYNGGVTKAKAEADGYNTSYDASSYSDKKLNYVAIGDSITEGFGLVGEFDDKNNNAFYNISNSPENSYPNKVAEILKDRDYGTYNVKNLGVPTLTCFALHNLLEGYYDALYKDPESSDNTKYVYKRYNTFRLGIDGTTLPVESKLDEAITGIGEKQPSNFTTKAEKEAYLQAKGVDYAPYILDKSGKLLTDYNSFVKGFIPVANERYMADTRDYTSLFRDQLKDADLVTVAIGSNDILRSSAVSMLFKDDPQTDQNLLVVFKDFLTECSKEEDPDIQDIILPLLGQFQSPAEIANNVLHVNDYLDIGVSELTEYYDDALGSVEKYTADDAQIVLLGSYNPYSIRTFAYLLAAKLDNGNFTKTTKKNLDTALDIAFATVSNASASELATIVTNYTAKIKEIAETVTAQSDYTLMALCNDVVFLTMPLIAATVGADIQYNAMDKFSAVVEQYAEDHNYIYVPLDDMSSGGRLDPHPTAEGHQDIAEAIADAIISDVKVEIEGSGTVEADGTKVKSGDSVYLSTKVNHTIKLMPADGYKLYSVSVNGQYRTPSVSSETGIGTLTEEIKGVTTIKVKFVSKSENTNGIGMVDATKKYNKIFALGDSVTAGIELTGFNSSLDSIINMLNAKNSPKEAFPNVLAKYLDAELLANYGSSTLTTFGLYSALTDSGYDFNYLKGIDLSETYYNVFTKYGEIENADLITLQIGYSELLFGIVTEMTAIEGVSDALATDLAQQVIKGDSIQDIMKTFITTMSVDAESTQAFYDAVTSMLAIFEENNLEKIYEKSLVTINEYLPKVITKLHELNPSADIALIGYYNPYKLSNVSKVDVSGFTKLLSSATGALTLLLDKNSLISMFDQFNYPAAALLLGTVSESAVQKANGYIEACAKDDPKTIYVDITDISRQASLSPYPDAEGHSDIANKIVDAVINEVTITSKGGATKVTPIGSDSPITIAAGETVSLPVKFSETLYFDLGYENGNNVSTIKVDGASAKLASDFYLSGNKKNRTVEITYGTGTSSRSPQTVSYIYEPDSTSSIDYMMDSLVKVSYNGAPFMIPEKPDYLIAPSGKMFGGWMSGTKVYQPGEVVTLNSDTTLAAYWVTDPTKTNETFYKVTVEGGVTVDGLNEYTAGSKVFIYANTKEGGKFKGWTASAEDLYIVDKEAVCTYFFMPNQNVTLTANWEGGTDSGDTSVLPFTDVKTTDWFYKGVLYCYNNKIMNGMTTTTFEPQTAISRAMIVTMLYRMENEPAVGAYNPFTDVVSGSYYEKAVKWAYANGIVTGYKNNTFAPNKTITREEFAAILFRFAKYKGYDVTYRNYLYKYTDVNTIANYASDAMAWANYNGIIAGTSNTKIDPKGSATRAQSATIIQRFETIFNPAPEESATETAE